MSDGLAPGESITFGKAIDAFLSYCRFEKNLSVKTIAAYAIDLRQFCERVPGAAERDVGGFDRGTLRNYIKLLFGTYAVKSVKRKIATLKAIFAFLEREDLVASSPFRKLDLRIREKKRLPRTLSLAEVQLLFQHLYHLRDENAGDTHEPHLALLRDIAVVEALFATAARVSELCTLSVDNVDLTQGRIRIMGKGGKERMVHVSHAAALLALREYHLRFPGCSRDGYFFRQRKGGRLSEQLVRKILRQRANAAGIAGRITPHMFRHTVATLLLEEGVDIRYIQHLLGHSSISTTQLYTQVSAPHQESLLAIHHPRRRLSVP